MKYINDIYNLSFYVDFIQMISTLLFGNETLLIIVSIVCHFDDNTNTVKVSGICEEGIKVVEDSRYAWECGSFQNYPV